MLGSRDRSSARIPTSNLVERSFRRGVYETIGESKVLTVLASNVANLSSEYIYHMFTMSSTKTGKKSVTFYIQYLKLSISRLTQWHIVKGVTPTG
mmetsp:Transcript_1476/g.2129  ORF Transcript_1476/g.2129 Transcript_1476/m.2129 type:complete len:95 (+) Transcript_1476:341-625(+)